MWSGSRAEPRHRGCRVGVFKRWEVPFEVTAPCVHRRRGIRVHRASLERRDITVQLGLRVTSAARTMLDIAPRLSDKALVRGVDDLRRPGRLHLADLADVLVRFPRSPGRPLDEREQPLRITSERLHATPEREARRLHVILARLRRAA